MLLPIIFCKQQDPKLCLFFTPQQNAYFHSWDTTRSFYQELLGNQNHHHFLIPSYIFWISQSSGARFRGGFLVAVKMTNVFHTYFSEALYFKGKQQKCF